MTQLHLFDSSNLARAVDPPTSVDAAMRVVPKLSGMRAEFVRCLRELGRPATAQEVSRRADPDIRESVRKRAKECVRLGFVKEFGTKCCEVTGQRAICYWI